MNRRSDAKKKRVSRVPKFKSEAQEAAWWDANADFIAETFERAKAEGRVIRRPPTKSVAIRLPVDDIVRARRLAQQKGVGYQTLVKMLLHEALSREEKRF